MVSRPYEELVVLLAGMNLWGLTLALTLAACRRNHRPGNCGLMVKREIIQLSACSHVRERVVKAGLNISMLSVLSV